MKPATLHMVVTPEASICHGGHFYTMSTISDTVYGIMHTFVGSSVLTNTQHTADSRMLLQQSMSHVYSLTVAEGFQPSSYIPTLKSVHIPKLNTVKGVVDFFNLLSVTELSNILNPLATTLVCKSRKGCESSMLGSYQEPSYDGSGATMNFMRWWMARAG